ncbi:UNKNOWN [Stylonychia lemnae]|uniref:Band 7 domain-containing protein n=1 Tax=Stylonychia lemnae TaxID=5949 RepID=A0A078ABJ6_STYLE|nr:UNKNOWN [Stylonychia lemnae]|eukprot:CDW78952.1 UNKNOWN [Stylonychia lemnae]
MLSKNRNHTKRQGSTRLAAIRVQNIDDSLEWFGNYTPDGETPIILMPSRSSCAPYIYVPEGTYAVITKHGEFLEIKKEGGVYFCMPYVYLKSHQSSFAQTQIQYLVTQQNVVFDMEVKSCPTYDNIFIYIDVAAVFKCKDDDASIERFVYNISINQLNKQIKAAITERIRVLARGKTHLEVYQIKGKEHTSEIIEFLNKMFHNKGLEFTRIIVQNVKLPQEIAQPLDQKAQYGSMNDFERTRHEYDMRVLNDNKELEIIKQTRQQQRLQFNEDFNRQLALVERELKVIQAEGQKMVSEIKEKTKAEEKRIQAESELKAAEIRADNQILQAKLLAQGLAEAQTTQVSAENQSKLILAEQESKVAEKNSDAIKIEGQAEGELSKVLGLRRLYEYLNKKLDIVKQMGQNPNLKIFGNSDDSSLSQMAAYGIINRNNLQQ